MDNERLTESMRSVARAILPAAEQRKQASVHSAFKDSGDVKPEALRRSLPPLMLTWWLPGPVVAGSNVSAEIPLAGNIRLTVLAIRAKTAPSGAECKVRLTANGSEVENVSLPPGQVFGSSPVSGAKALRNAGEVLRVDVVTGNGAEGVTVTATYAVADE